MRRACVIAATLACLIPARARAEAWSGILDEARATDWSGAGAGAIPARATLCTTLGTAGQGPTFAQPVTVAQINAALASCSTGQAVLLNPGTYNTGGATIMIPSNVTLRGSGPARTVIAETGTVMKSPPVINFGTQSAFPYGSEPYPAKSTTITGGTTHGSKSITVASASASGIKVGTLLALSQNDLPYMTNLGSGATCTYCSGVGGLSGQTVQVTAVSGNTLTLSDPLYIDYTSSPVAFPWEASCTAAGLEDLKISASGSQVVNTNGSGYINIVMTGVIGSWVKNVESDFAQGSHVHIDFSLHNTVRDSFFHDGFDHGPGVTDDELRLGYKTSANLIENNIFWRQHTSIIVEFGASGNVLAYNYSTANNHQGSTWNLEDISFHGPHPMMNLFEGNITTHWQMDQTHGSSSHSTIFRSYSTGANIFLPPQNGRGTIQAQGPMQQTANAYAFVFSNVSQYNNMVGVIAGADYLVNGQKAAARLVAPQATKGNPACILVGYEDDTSMFTTPNLTETTMLYQGVMDCTTGTFQWQNGSQTLPASFYLSAKPAWWDAEPWPPIGPDVTGGDFADWENATAATARGHVNKIPAVNCFNTSTANGTTNTGAFDATKCYYGAPPPPPGDGGVTADGGAAGTGGGAAGTGGVAGTGGGAGSGDAAGTGGGAGNGGATGAGGGAGNGGATGAGGATGGRGAKAPGSSGGCSCEAGPSGTTAPAWWGVMALALCAIVRARRRSPKRQGGAAGGW
jgi:MYXO-CTERM domain-containing protein